MPEHAIMLVVECRADAFRRNVLDMWTVYDHPRDYPDGFVARRFEVSRDLAAPTPDVLHGNLQTLRDTFEQAGLTVLQRNPDDDPKIVEVWL